jgi:hypothetical protein
VCLKVLLTLVFTATAKLIILFFTQGPGQDCIEKPTSQLKCSAALMCNCGKCVGCTATRECYFNGMCPKGQTEIKRSTQQNDLNWFGKRQTYYQ